MSSTEKQKTPYKIIIITALTSAFFVYTIPRLGNFMVPPSEESLSITSIGDTLRFVDATRDGKEKIIHTETSYEYGNKPISSKDLVKRVNKIDSDNYYLKDSLRAYKIAYKDLVKDFNSLNDSLYKYKNISKIVEDDFDLKYQLKKNGDKTDFIRTKGKVDSSLILFELYGDRLYNDDGVWRLLTNREYRKSQRQ